MTEEPHQIDIHCTRCPMYGCTSARELMPKRCPGCGGRIVESASKGLPMIDWKHYTPSTLALARHFPRN